MILDSFKIEATKQDPVWIFSTHGYINNSGGEAIAKKFNEVYGDGGRLFLFDLDPRLVSQLVHQAADSRYEAQVFQRGWAQATNKAADARLGVADSRIINSIGVSYIIEILEKVLESEGKIAFCNCVPIIAKTFKIMGITQYASIYGTTDEALEAMPGNPQG